MKYRFLAIILSLLFVSTQAEARRHHYRPQPVQQQNVIQDFFTGGELFASPTQQTSGRQRYSRRGYSRSASYSGGSVVGGRPSGCPHSYCGCGASIQVFGRIVPGLNLAANWLRFPRTSPAPGMVAARRGHVFVLQSQNSDGSWVVHDSNSGGGRTRVHTRSLAGYSIVNPRA